MLESNRNFEDGTERLETLTSRSTPTQTDIAAYLKAWHAALSQGVAAWDPVRVQCLAARPAPPVVVTYRDQNSWRSFCLG